MKKYDIYDIDKNALFDRITNAIDNAPSSPDDTDFSAFDIPETETGRPRLTFTKSFLTAAAAVIILFAALPMLIYIDDKHTITESNFPSSPETAAADEAKRSDDRAKTDDIAEKADDDYDDYCEEYADAVSEESAGPQELYFPASDGWEFSSVSISSAKSYAETETEGILPYESASKGNTGTALFSEENVLDNTDFFLDCIVEGYRADIFEDDIAFYYTVTPVHTVSRKDLTLPETFEIRSGDAYILRTGHEYLIPVKITDSSGFEAADKSSPQTEITPERYVIFHNGWKELGNSEHERIDLSAAAENDLIAPDDFFYDRLNITVEANLRELFDAYLGKQ